MGDPLTRCTVLSYDVCVTGLFFAKVRAERSCYTLVSRLDFCTASHGFRMGAYGLGAFNYDVCSGLALVSDLHPTERKASEFTAYLFVICNECIFCFVGTSCPSFLYFLGCLCSSVGASPPMVGYTATLDTQSYSYCRTCRCGDTNDCITELYWLVSLYALDDSFCLAHPRNPHRNTYFIPRYRSEVESLAQCVVHCDCNRSCIGFHVTFSYAA